MNKLLDENNQTYLSKLLDSTEELLNDSISFGCDRSISQIDMLDKNISAICCELLQQGYSKNYLFFYVRKRFVESKQPFTEIMNAFRNKFAFPEMNKYTVVFRFRLRGKSSNKSEIPEFLQEIPAELLDGVELRNKALTKVGNSIRFYVVKCEALDSISAIRKSKMIFSAVLDAFHLGLSNLQTEMFSHSLVFTEKEGTKEGYDYPTDYLLDGSFSDDVLMANRFREHLHTIGCKDCISKGVKDRIEAAIRHLRIGNESSELEQRFINYWIALEFIFSSPTSGENTYGRLKDNLINVMTSCYMRRNLLNLNELLIKNGTIYSGDSFWKEDDFDRLISKQNSVLIKYRLFKTKHRLVGKEAERRNYIENHQKNLERQLARIYRMRNELIHEAAIKGNIENITSNLRYYLVFLLNQMIIYFSSLDDKLDDITLEDFFLEYELHKKKIADKWDLKSLMDVPLELDLLK